MSKRLHTASRQYKHKISKLNSSWPAAHNVKNKTAPNWELPKNRGLLENIKEVETCVNTSVPYNANNINANNSTMCVENNVQINLCTELSLWALQHNISLSAITHLLKVLSNHGITVPKDARTLLQTPTHTKPLQIVSPGQYYHHGVREPLIRKLNSCNDYFLNGNNTILKCIINIDGIPIHKSTTNCVWPIQIKVTNLDNFTFIAGAYHGLKKPDSFNEFLKPFTN